MKISIFQMTSVLDYQENLKKIENSITKVKKEGSHYLFLPECFYSMSDGQTPTPYLIEEGNEHYQNIKSLAIDSGLYLIGGSVAAKEGDRIVNRSLNFSPKGEDLGHYDKMHLFSCDLTNKRIDEADIYTPGKKSKIIHIEPLKIGLGICFDLRYPEMSRDYALQGSNLLTFASAFTIPTGKAHWHTLVRARAIENQCFVVAAAQWGQHNDKIQTFGHSIVIDPWGDILVDAQEGEKTITVDLNIQRLTEVRRSIRVF